MRENLKITGKEIRKRREALGWSQVQLAANAGLSPATIYRLESGRVWSRQQTIRAAWEALTGRA